MIRPIHRETDDASPCGRRASGAGAAVRGKPDFILISLPGRTDGRSCQRSPPDSGPVNYRWRDRRSSPGARRCRPSSGPVDGVRLRLGSGFHPDRTRLRGALTPPRTADATPIRVVQPLDNRLVRGVYWDWCPATTPGHRVGRSGQPGSPPTGRPPGGRHLPVPLDREHAGSTSIPLLREPSFSYQRLLEGGCPQRSPRDPPPSRSGVA